MAAKKNPLSDKAYEMYKSGMLLKDIAAQLDTPEGTVRRWKSTYKWDGERSDSKSERSDKKRAERDTDISWVDIEHEYVTDIRKNPCTLEGLANKYNIPLKTIKDRSAKDGWVNKRTEYVLQTCQKAREKSSDVDADRIARLLSIADIAADKAEQALGELEQYVVSNKKKVKTVEYNCATALGKPTKEVIEETEDMATVTGPIDRLGLSQVTSALKNLKDLYALPSAMEMQEHSKEVDKRKLELDLLKVEMQAKESGNAEPVKDNFLDALNQSAQEVWTHE